MEELAREAGAKRWKTEGGEVILASEWFVGEDMKEVTMRVLAEGEAGTRVRYLTMQHLPPLAHPSIEASIVLEHQCYVTLFDQLVEIIKGLREQRLSKKNIHISGTPAIGKSRIYLYCIFRLALDGAVRAALPVFQLQLNCDNRYHLYDPDTRSFAWVRGEAELDDLERDRCVVRLVEGSSDRLSGWHGISIFLSSPEHAGIQDFLKDHGYTYVMPTWSLTELRAYNALPHSP